MVDRRGGGWITIVRCIQYCAALAIPEGLRATQCVSNPDVDAEKKNHNDTTSTTYEKLYVVSIVPSWFSFHDGMQRSDDQLSAFTSPQRWQGHPHAEVRPRSARRAGGLI